MARLLKIEIAQACAVGVHHRGSTLGGEKETGGTRRPISVRARQWTARRHSEHGQGGGPEKLPTLQRWVHIKQEEWAGPPMGYFIDKTGHPDNRLVNSSLEKCRQNSPKWRPKELVEVLVFPWGQVNEVIRCLMAW
ncbi:MAG TPA: hypothetical protein VLD18_12965, partial [Verrucomicrobiae bacterium]|nr:hypothetical protein [Verrucomicrobiae bacterium]